MNRIFEAWYGAQRSGKTYQLRKRARDLSDRPSIRRVIVVAPEGEWLDICERVTVPDLSDALIDYRDDDGRPQRSKKPVLVSGVELGDHSRLSLVLRDVIRWGDCCVIIDEGWAWFPSGPTSLIKRENPRLLNIVVRGRHLERADSQLRPTHLIIATQYPKTISHLVAEQAATIMVSRPDRDLTRQWIRGNSSPAMLRRAEELGQFQWLALKGRDPRRG